MLAFAVVCDSSLSDNYQWSEKWNLKYIVFFRCGSGNPNTLCSQNT